jgi:hypothetical protein
MNRSLAAVACLALAGCLTHVAPRSDEHLHVRWVDGFETARGIAAETGRPILLVMVAGELREHC